FALDVDALERAVDGGVEHVGDTQAGLLLELDAPVRLEELAGRVDRDMAIAGKLVRERAHVTRALHVVLAAERVYPYAGPANVAGRHAKVGNAHHCGRALAVLGDAETVIDRAVAARGKEPCRGTDGLGRHAGDPGYRLRAVLRVRDEFRPMLEGIDLAAL